MVESYSYEDNVNVSSIDSTKNTKEDKEDELKRVEDMKKEEELNAIQDTKETLFQDVLLRIVYANLNFGYSTEDISSIREKMINRFDDKDSLDWILFNNTQIQNFINNCITQQWKDWENHNKNNPDQNKESKDNDSIESWEEYSSRESAPENYEQFLLSDEWIRILKEEINDHIDPSTWKFYTNYPISQKVLQLKLRKAWFNNMRKQYNETYGITIDNEKMNIKKYKNFIDKIVEKTVWDYLKWWGYKSGDLPIELFGSLDWLMSDMREDDVNMDDFKVFLKESIKRYANIVLKRRQWEEKIQLSTWETQLDLELKSYLYIYGKFFYKDDFKWGWILKDYDKQILDIFEAILYFDGKLEIVQNNRYIAQEKRAEEERLERDRQRRRAIAERNRKLNNMQQPQNPINFEPTNIEAQAKSKGRTDITWSEMAAEAKLWEDLQNYELDIKEPEQKTQWMKEAAFNTARDKFIQSHDILKSVITHHQMHDIFDINAGMINNDKWEDFITRNPFFKWMPEDKINKIYTELAGFSNYFKNELSSLTDNSSDAKTKIDETIKTYAIGTVIDNVKDTFLTISEKQNWNFKWFEFKEENAVKIYNNCLIISGYFNGSNIKVRYDLKTGKLFINSFINKVDAENFRIWNNLWIDEEVWKIPAFEEVLANYVPNNSPKDSINIPAVPPRGPEIPNIDHKRPSNNMQTELRQQKPNIHDMRNNIIPPNRGMNNEDLNSKKDEIQNILDSQINLVSKAIENCTEGQAQKNSIINKFMKTFNIMPNSSDVKSLDFNTSSNIFDVIQIVSNTADPEKGDIESLEYFDNKFMPVIMKYSWLEWWNRNEYQNKKNGDSEKIFNYDGNNENKNYLKNKVKDFNPDQFSGVGLFDGSQKLLFADLITEKIIIWEKPSWKLNKLKMERFLKTLDLEDHKTDNTEQS